MQKYIIAVVGGARKDIAPEYPGTLAKVFKYGRFNLIIWTGGSWGDDYEKAYQEVSDYVTKCNDELKGNKYYSGWLWAEMLTPKEHHEYNETRCNLFHSWFATEMIKSDSVIVTKINVGGGDIRSKFAVWTDLKKVAELARIIEGEMLQSIHLPGDYMHNLCCSPEDSIYLKDYPIFVFGWTLPYKVQLIDESFYFTHKKD